MRLGRQLRSCACPSRGANAPIMNCRQETRAIDNGVRVPAAEMRVSQQRQNCTQHEVRAQEKRPTHARPQPHPSYA
eukprot:1138603-Pelagomonas_calceolata.AAC.5